MATQFRVLGQIEALVDGSVLDVGHARQRSVLAVLLIEANRVVAVDQLIERVWGLASAPKDPRSGLRTYLWHLRRALAAAKDVALVRRTPGYTLEVNEEQVDLHRFRGLLTRAEMAHDDSQAAALLEEALGLWRGEPLAGLDVPWINDVRQNLLSRRHMARLDLTDLHLRRGRHAALLTELTDQAAEHPFDERIAGQLMLALYRSGRPADALAEYRRLRKQLADELGSDPGPAMQLLHQQILTDDEALAIDGPERADQGRPTVVPRELPAAPRLFTGRAGELARLSTALDRLTDSDCTPMVAAISGAGGMGKTWLALHWAHQNLERFPDGQLYVNLRGFDPSGRPMPAETAVRGFLDALGAPPGAISADPEAQAAQYRSLLADKRMLIVADNARDAAQVIPLLPGSPTCTVLVTSRHRLTSLITGYGALPVHLDALSEGEARKLLLRHFGSDRVTANPGAMVAILEYCAGLPLALGIVAARAGQTGFPLAALAAELGSACQRLDVLDGGDPGTQLRAVFSWSYNTLSPGAARLFRFLGVGLGPDITAAAAASLVGVPLRKAWALLSELARASLLAEHEPGRYACHDLLLAYARELADTYDDTETQHAAVERLLDHYLHTAHAAALLLAPARDPLALPPTRTGVIPEQHADFDQALAWFTAEHHVLLAAVERATIGWDIHAWQLAWVLHDVLDRTGHWSERVQVARSAVAAAGRLADLPALVRAHRFLAHAYIRLDRAEEAHHELRQALELSDGHGDAVSRAHTHHMISMLSRQQGRYAEVLEHTEHALRLFQAAGHRNGQASTLHNLGWVYSVNGDYQHALTYCGQALELLRELGNRDGESAAWDSLGVAHHHLGHYDQALDCYQHALSLQREVGYPTSIATTLTHLGDTQSATGDTAAAHAAWDEALAILTELDHPDAETLRDKLSTLGL